MECDGSQISIFFFYVIMRLLWVEFEFNFFSADLNDYCIMYMHLLKKSKNVHQKTKSYPASTKPTSRSTRFTPHAILPLRPIL